MSAQPLVIYTVNPSRGELLRNILRDGYSGPIHLFSRFSECVDFTRREKVRLIYLDLEADNRELQTWLKKQEDDVIGMITWRWEEEQLRSFVEAGLYDYIFMPPQPGEIIDQLQEYLRQFD